MEMHRYAASQPSEMCIVLWMFLVLSWERGNSSEPSKLNYWLKPKTGLSDTPVVLEEGMMPRSGQRFQSCLFSPKLWNGWNNQTNH